MPSAWFTQTHHALRSFWLNRPDSTLDPLALTTPYVQFTMPCNLFFIRWFHINSSCLTLDSTSFFPFLSLLSFYRGQKLRQHLKIPRPKSAKTRFPFALWPPFVMHRISDLHHFNLSIHSSPLFPRSSTIYPHLSCTGYQIATILVYLFPLHHS